MSHVNRHLNITGGTNAKTTTTKYSFLSPDGKIVMGGTDGTNNETLQFDFETVANIISLTSPTGITAFDFGTDLMLGLNGRTVPNPSANGFNVWFYGGGTNASHYMKLNHDKTNGNISVGFGNLELGADLVNCADALTAKGILTTENGRNVSVTRVTGNTTLTNENHHVFGNTDSVGFTITLPAGAAGIEYRIVNTGSSSNNLTIAPNGSEHLLGANSNFTLFDGESLTIAYNTADGWY